MKINCDFAGINPQKVCRAEEVKDKDYEVYSPNRFTAYIKPTDDSCLCFGGGEATKVVAKDRPGEIEKITHRKRCFLMEALSGGVRRQIEAMLELANSECPLAKEVREKMGK